MKQSRELFLQTTKLVKRKNNNLEKFCSRRVSHIYTEREHIIIYGEREREREREREKHHFHVVIVISFSTGCSIQEG